MKKILLIFVSFCLAAEMEIDGDLKVLGNLDAPGLGGMKPERIYTHISNNDYFSFTVPQNKVWYVEIALTGMSNRSSIRINSIRLELIDDSYTASGNPNFVLQPSSTLENDDYGGTFGNVVLSIYEYSISGSGTDQGMDYIEP